MIEEVERSTASARNVVHEGGLLSKGRSTAIRGGWHYWPSCLLIAIEKPTESSHADAGLTSLRRNSIWSIRELR